MHQNNVFLVIFVNFIFSFLAFHKFAINDNVVFTNSCTFNGSSVDTFVALINLTDVNIISRIKNESILIY